MRALCGHVKLGHRLLDLSEQCAFSLDRIMMAVQEVVKHCPNSIPPHQKALVCGTWPKFLFPTIRDFDAGTSMVIGAQPTTRTHIIVNLATSACVDFTTKP